MHAVYITSVVLLMAIASAAPQDGKTIHITGPAQVIVCNPVSGTTQEGNEVPTAEQCTGGDGFCVETGDHCNGTIKILHNSCNDRCTCCVPGSSMAGSLVSFPAVCQPPCKNGGYCSAPNQCTCHGGYEGASCETRIPHNGFFLQGNHSDVTAQAGATANLHCQLSSSLTDGMVSWVRRRDYHILTVGHQTYSSDQRVGVKVSPDGSDWVLTIQYVEPHDAGQYECQVYSHTPQALMVNLHVVDTAVCQPPCKNGGYCSAANQCTCRDGYEGASCETPVCNPPCKNGGYCNVPNQCTCHAGYGGASCETPLCYPECMNGGKCVAPNYCRCPSDYTGYYCETVKSVIPDYDYDYDYEAAPIEIWNYSPDFKNPIDYLTATEGHLFIFKVNRDTCYDFEDGDSTNLRMRLLTSTNDPSELPPKNWLQFDQINIEFYGIPLENDVGTKDYILECVDSGGKKAVDALTVNVHGRDTSKQPPVEFQILIQHISYDGFMSDSIKKKQLIEKIAEVFGDSNTQHIAVKSLSGPWGSVVVSWHNSSLSSEPCPSDEIKALQEKMLDDNGKILPSFVASFHPFNVSRGSIVPLAACLGTEEAAIQDNEENEGVVFVSM